MIIQLSILKINIHKSKNADELIAPTSVQNQDSKSHAIDRPQLY